MTFRGSNNSESWHRFCSIAEIQNISFLKNVLRLESREAQLIKDHNFKYPIKRTIISCKKKILNKISINNMFKVDIRTFWSQL